jgi:purine-binding chemotaxis protein CheW
MKPSRADKKRIDWQEVRQRLARLSAVAAEAVQPPASRARAILEERARALARVPPSVLQRQDGLEVVTFTLANELYALPAEHVRAVVHYSGCTPIPEAPEVLAGIVNLRGDILAVFDLGKLFGLVRSGSAAWILVLGGDRPEFGVLADAVHSIAVMPLDDILEPPATLAGAGRDLVRGVTAGALILLDGPRLLQSQHFYIDLADR